MLVGLMQLVESLTITKWLTFPRVRENSSCLITFELEHWLFLTLGLQLKYWLFLCLKPAGLPMRTTPLIIPFLRPLNSIWNYTIDPLEFLLCQLTLQTLEVSASISSWDNSLQSLCLSLSHSLPFSLSPSFCLCLFLSLSSPSFYIYRYRYTITHIHTLHYMYLLVLFLWITLINTDSELNKWSRRQNSDRGHAGFSIWTCNLYASFLLLCHFYNNYHYC